MSQATTEAPPAAAPPAAPAPAPVPAASPPPAEPAPAPQPQPQYVPGPSAPAAGPAPAVHVHVNTNDGGGGGPAGGGGRGRHKALGRSDPFRTTSEFVQWADEARSELLRLGDWWVYRAEQIEAGIKRTGKWPFKVDRLLVARRVGRHLRQNAGRCQDSAKALSAAVNVLAQLREDTGQFDPTK